MSDSVLSRADEVSDLLDSLQKLIHPFIEAADTSVTSLENGHRKPLVEHHEPQDLSRILKLDLPERGVGKEGLMNVVEMVLKYSVNTWDRGFMDKLYGATNAVGVASELLLSVLNTNVHVNTVSPTLTQIEKYTTRSLASLIGYTTPNRGGVSQPGGSASNLLSVILARNTLFPSTKTDGNGPHKFRLFVSKHSHYSLSKAAQILGLGSNAVISIPVDLSGRMLAASLQEAITKSRERGETPLYICATAGTTVMGSYDPIIPLSAIAKSENLWLHIDGSWGGAVIFSPSLRATRMLGVELADSVAITPHKMLGVPVTCSFLLGPDLDIFHGASSIEAGYLFHGNVGGGEIYDLADLTPQCGRKGDALKLFLGWTYYGTSGYARQLENAFETAEYFYSLLDADPRFVVVSEQPLPCLQVCFYWAGKRGLSGDKVANGRITERIVNGLVGKGYMVDYAPGEMGKFFRVVVNRDTRRETVEGLVKAIEDVAGRI
ncbi:PLP-dependent transferase [Venturia nashicola]|uniref:PLP-dependent transferase n=1 Tax=Venturia nashicola TaxID=86259 RepID=A0A4Z1P2H5_9PEZI|nr:PLP-dependent transferase [Venturia nashicola]TLD19396.1 PLP-dependent transferase [Venturia nashicola]